MFKKFKVLQKRFGIKFKNSANRKFHQIFKTKTFLMLKYYFKTSQQGKVKNNLFVNLNKFLELPTSLQAHLKLRR